MIEEFTNKHKCYVTVVSDFAHSLSSTNKHINFMWSAIYQEIQTRKISFESYSQFINYLCIKHSCTKIENKFKLEYIIRELNNYNTMSEEFARNSKNYIHRLKIYARKRKCTNMQQLKNELEHYLRSKSYNTNK